MANLSTLAGAGGESNGITESTLDKLERVGVFILLEELERVGMFITDLGHWPEARVIKEFISNGRCRPIGEKHPPTIRATNNLATTLIDQSQLGEAVKMFKGVLGEGEAHPRRGASGHDLGDEQ